MTAHNDLDRQLNDFLRDGPDELPYQSFDAVRDRTERTRQRVVFGPWRLPDMNKIVSIGLGAAAVILILIVGAQLLGEPSGGVGTDPTPTPEPTATPEPSVSAAAAPPLTQTFTSTQHGFSASYPEGWTAQAATDAWADGPFQLEWGLPHADWLFDPDQTSNLFVAIASQPIGGSAAADWVAEQMESDEGCATTEAITVAGVQGAIGAGDCNVVVVTSADRGYWIQLYTSSDDPEAIGLYDRAWFEEFLATVQLHPEDAVD